MLNLIKKKFFKNKETFKKKNIFWNRYFLFRSIIRALEEKNYTFCQIMNKRWKTNFNEKIFLLLIEISKKKKLKTQLTNKFFEELNKQSDNFNLSVSIDLYDFFCQIGKYQAATKIRYITSTYLLNSKLNYVKNSELILKCSFINYNLSLKYKKFQKGKDDLTSLLYSTTKKQILKKNQKQKKNKLQKFFFDKKVLILGPSKISNETKKKNLMK